MTDTSGSRRVARRASLRDDFLGGNSPELARAPDDTQAVPAPLPTHRAFDYGTVAPDLADRLREQAAGIQTKIASTTAAIIDIGRDLLAVKQQIEHGQFIDWVETQVGIEIRTAQRYVRAAEFIGDDKNDIVSLLPATVIYAISSRTTPRKITDQVIERARGGDTVSAADIRRMLDNAKFERREAAAKQRIAGRRSKQSRQRRAAEQMEAQRWLDKEEQRAQATAQDIISTIGLEHARYLADVLRPGEMWKVLDHLRQEVDSREVVVGTVEMPELPTFLDRRAQA